MTALRVGISPVLFVLLRRWGPLRTDRRAPGVMGRFYALPRVLPELGLYRRVVARCPVWSVRLERGATRGPLARQ